MTTREFRSEKGNSTDGGVIYLVYITLFIYNQNISSSYELI